MAQKTAIRRKSRSTKTAQRRAAPAKAPGTLDAKARTVRATIATDTPVAIWDDLGNGEYGYIDEVLLPAGMIEPRKMPLRVDHNSYSARGVIGRVTDFEISETEVNAVLQFSAAADVQEIYQRVSEGHLDEVSIGATYRMADTTTLQPGQSAEFDGRKYTAIDRPMRVVEKWAAQETSVVDFGADPRAVIRSQIRTAKGIAAQLKQTPGTGGPISTSRDDMKTKVKRGQPRNTAQGTSADQKQRQAARRAVRSVVAKQSAEGPDDNDADDTDGGESQTTQRAHRPGAREALEQADRRAAERAGSSATAEQIETARREERARVGRIRELGQGEPDELVTRAINDGLTPEQFGLAVLERMRGQSAAHQTAQSGDGVNRAAAVHSKRRVGVESLQAAVLMRAGINLQNPVFGTEAARVVLERNHCGWLHRFNAEIGGEGNSELEQHIDVGRRFYSDSAARTCERILEIDGNRDSGDVEEMVQRAFSTPYLPRVFGAIVSVGLIQGYMEFNDSTRGWTSQADWNDFRENQPIGLDMTQGLRKHVKGTTAKDIDIADFGDAYAINRYTGRFVMDEMDIINDTVGANQMMPSQMGILAAELVPDLIYSVLQTNGNLKDGVPLFHASRGNLVLSNPLSLEGLSVAEAALAQQTVKNKSGQAKAKNMMAGWLVVPRRLRGLGKQITASATVVHGNTTATGNVNPHDGEYTLRSDARLDIGVVNPDTEVKTTGSASTYYVGEQSGQMGLQVGYRRGTGRAPAIRARPLTGPGEFGYGWDIAHDVGVGILKAAALVQCRA
jgi:hypothetical protein